MSGKKYYGGKSPFDDFHVICFLSLVSNPTKNNQSITYSILLLIWNTHGLVWMALLFNLVIRFFYDMELKLTEDSSEVELEREEKETAAEFSTEPSHLGSDQEGGPETQPAASPQTSHVSCLSTAKFNSDCHEEKSF